MTINIMLLDSVTGIASAIQILITLVFYSIFIRVKMN